MKRVAIALALLLALPVAAGEPTPPPPPKQRLLWGRPADFYAGWSLVVAGGAASLAGIALTTGNVNADAADKNTSGTQMTTGWVLVGVGTASWIAGSLVFLLSDRKKR